MRSAALVAVRCEWAPLPLWAALRGEVAPKPPPPLRFDGEEKEESEKESDKPNDEPDTVDNELLLLLLLLEAELLVEGSRDEDREEAVPRLC